MGTSDLVNDLRAQHTPGREALLGPLSSAVLAARAYRLAILDGVYLDISDTAGFAAGCTQGRALGFDGKTLIHPSQIAQANATFGPSPEAVAHAHRVVEAWDAAQAEGKGVVLVDGALVENLHVAQAQRTLALASAIASL